MEDFLEEATPKLTLEEGVGITQSGGRRVFKAEEVIPAKARPHQGPLSNQIKVRHNPAFPTKDALVGDWTSHTSKFLLTHRVLDSR